MKPTQTPPAALLLALVLAVGWPMLAVGPLASLLAVGSLAFPGAAFAQTQSQPVRNPAAATSRLTTQAERERFHALAGELRCLVCQNQTLADSDAELAADLRREVEDLMLAGRSDDEIKAYLVQRYGDFVLYRPPLQRNTWLLWVGPFALLVVGGIVWRRVQRARATPDDGAQGDLERARRLLD